MIRTAWIARPAAVALLLGLVAGAPGPLTAQTGGPFDLSWSTVDGGGDTASTGGAYELSGTAGQPDAGPLAGGDYVLHGGFWYGGALIVAVEDDPPTGPDGLPAVHRLYRAAPNPFNPATQIAFDLPRPGRVRLAIHDLRGALVRVLEDGSLPAGHHVRLWDGTDDGGAAVASGTYIVTIDAGDFRARQKGMLLK